MADYCRTAAMDTFIASKGDRHPTDLAALKGARIVCASETEEGRQWSETRVKLLTGGDKIAARFGECHPKTQFGVAQRFLKTKAA